MSTDKNQHSEESGDDSSMGEEEVEQNIANKFIDFTNVLATIESQQRHSDKFNQIPAVKRRIKAMKKLQLDATNIEAEFFKEVHALECKYHKLYIPLYEKRDEIVNGKYEPNDEEAQWPSDDDEEDNLGDQLKTKAIIEDNAPPAEQPPPPEEVKDVKGVPNFWLTIFQNVTILAEMVQPTDEPILSFLTDIKVECKDNPMGFTLSFHFAPNQYFTNAVLTKDYFMNCEPEKDDPFVFEGPEIFKCKGCTINWNKGMNVTLKTIKKKQKHKSRGVVRTVTKTVQNDSFFNFFAPPDLPESAKGEQIDDELRQLLTSDFEIGHYIRERIVPRAVLFYTGEVIDLEEDDFDEEDDVEESSEDEETNNKGTKKTNPGQDDKCKQQ